MLICKITRSSCRKGNEHALPAIRRKIAGLGDSMSKPAAMPPTPRRAGSGSGSQLDRMAAEVRELSERQSRLQEAIACVGGDGHSQLLQVVVMIALE